MKTLPAKNYKILLLLTAVVSLFFIAGCARKISFAKSAIVPAASGRVKIKRDNNKNYAIQISVENLAKSNKLSPPKSTYVVWMETEDHGTKNIGQLNTSTGLLSSKLKASLNTVTPYKPRKIFVKAENNASLSYPQGSTVLATGSF